MTRKGNSENPGQAKSSVQSFFGKLGLALFVIMVFLTISQCTVKKPEAPEWNTNLTVPLVNRTYPMSELLQKIDDDGLGFDSNQNVIFSITEELDTIQLDSDNLTTNPLNYSVSQTLGPIVISTPVIAPVVVDVANIPALAAAIPGSVPAVTFQIDNTMPTITNFSSATIFSGTVYVVVSNSLGLNLDVLNVSLIDAGSSTTIGTQSFPGGLLDGTTDSLAFDLSGTTISNVLEARLDTHTPGGTVLSASNKNITTRARFSSSLTVTSATAQIPSLDRNFSQQVALVESDAIHSASLSSGAISLSITNNTPLATTLTVTFPDITQAGTPLSVVQNIAANGSGVFNADLTGYQIEPTDLTVPQQLSVQVAASSAGSGASQVMISQGHQFSVNATLSSLTFDSVTGVFSATSTSIDQQVQNIDVPPGFDAMQLQNAVLTLEIENGVALPGNLTITVYGLSGETLVLDGPIAAGSSNSTVLTVLVDSNVASFLNPVPPSVMISGSATFGDSITVGSISSSDFVVARVKIFAPLEVIISQTQVGTDIEDIEIDQDNIDAITNHVITARLFYNVTNHLPVGARVSICLSSDSTTIFSNPTLRLDTIAVSAAPVVGGIVSDTLSTGWQSIVLTTADVQVLKNNPLFAATEIFLDDSNGQVVRLTANDFVSVSARLEVEYRFDGEF